MTALGIALSTYSQLVALMLQVRGLVVPLLRRPCR